MGVCVSERIQLKLKGPWDKASIARMDHLKDELNESCPDLSISGKIREDNDYLSIDWSNDGGYYFFDAIDQLFEEANNREIIEEYHALEETMAEKKLFFLVRDWQECEGYAETEVYELFYGGKSWKRIYGKLKDFESDNDCSEAKIFYMQNPEIENKSFCLTGIFQNSNNDLREISETIKRNGGRVIQSITDILDYLVVGDFYNPSNEKLKKALDVNRNGGHIQFISEMSVFNSMVELPKPHYVDEGQIYLSEMIRQGKVIDELFAVPEKEAITDCEFKDAPYRHIVLPKSLKRIGNYTFMRSFWLKEIAVPEGVISIGNKAFRNCPRLEEVYLPDSLKELRFDAFEECDSIKRIEAPDHLLIKYYQDDEEGNPDIELTAKETVKLLTRILPDEYICSEEYLLFVLKRFCDAKKYARKLKAAALKGYRKSIIEYLDSIMPEAPKTESTNDQFTLTELSSGTYEISSFKGKCTTVRIPLFIGEKKITAIGENAFKNNLEIEEVYVPDGIQSIGKNAFRGCRFLAVASLPENLEIIPKSCFENCFSLKQMNVPSGLKVIGDRAFKYCYSLRDFTLNDGLEKIGKDSLIAGFILNDNGDFADLYIPESLKHIDKAVPFYLKIRLLVKGNSAGHKYAVKNHIQYKLVDQPPVEIGKWVFDEDL